jgi:multidrug efflux pump subunit AcrA (membrane-fusion protein)
MDFAQETRIEDPMAIQDYYKKHKKTVTLAAIAVVVLVTVGMVMKSRSSQAKYLAAAVQQGDITAAVQATGTINPLTTVPVGSYVSGTVKYIFADFNSRVHAGQVLAQLDPAIYQAQVIQARGNLANAQANVQNLQASIAADQAAIQNNQANITRLKAAAEYARIRGRPVRRPTGHDVVLRAAGRRPGHRRRGATESGQGPTRTDARPASTG